MVKNPRAISGNSGSISGSGRSPGGGNGKPLQYSCLGNRMDRGAWRATDHGVIKNRTQLSNWAHAREAVRSRTAGGAGRVTEPGNSARVCWSGIGQSRQPPRICGGVEDWGSPRAQVTDQGGCFQGDSPPSLSFWLRGCPFLHSSGLERWSLTPGSQKRAVTSCFLRR